MARVGRLVLVKVVLMSLPIYALIVMDIPKWALKAMEKIIRAFLWKGQKEARGRHCPIAWDRVARSLDLGGLGIHNLNTMGLALRMPWLWLRKTERDRPWAAFNIRVPVDTRSMFAVAVITSIGDDATTLFWEDKWIKGQSAADLAPNLMPYLKKSAKRTRTVQQALQEDIWLSDFARGLPVQAIWEFMQLWDAVHEIELIEGIPDEHRWRFAASRKFSSKSAYRCFFIGSTNFEPHARLWRSWAPLRVKLFLWLAIMDRCWTADRLTRKGLQHPAACPSCDEQQDTIEHILIQYVLAREVWFQALKAVHLQALSPGVTDTLVEWWRRGHKTCLGRAEERILHFGYPGRVVLMEEQMRVR